MLFNRGPLQKALMFSGGLYSFWRSDNLSFFSLLLKALVHILLQYSGTGLPVSSSLNTVLRTSISSCNAGAAGELESTDSALSRSAISWLPLPGKIPGETGSVIGVYCFRTNLSMDLSLRTDAILILPVFIFPLSRCTLNARSCDVILHGKSLDFGVIILDTGGGSEFDNDGKGRGNIPTNGETAGETAAFERVFELGISDFPEDFVAAGVGGGLDTVCGANFLADFTPFFPGFFPTDVPPVVPLFILILGEITFSPFLRFIPLAGFSGLSLAITW